MSNPTSNFGWQMPTPTDLVTDLPADFEVFGQAVDSTMADLKGGTSGQILSKNSNTDMDFVWITNDQGDITGVTAGTGISGGGTSGNLTITNSMATEITAKGDLIVGTGSATFDNLAAGANGNVILADSTTSTGLRWQASMAGAKNMLVNGAMDFWQRGTSFTNNTSYSADRWAPHRSGFATGLSVSRQTVTSSDVGGSARYCMRFGRAAGDTSTAAIFNVQPIEQAIFTPYAGQTVTFSLWIRAGANYSGGSTIGLTLFSGTADFTIGGGGGTTTAFAGTSPTITTNWTRISLTGTVPSTGIGGLVQIAFTPSGTAGANDWVEITGLQYEIGSVPTTFTRSGGSIAGELSLCQRYYWRYTASGSNTAPMIGMMIGAATTLAQGIVKFPTTMRILPTSIDYSNLKLWDPGASAAITVTTANVNGASSSTDNAYGNFTAASGVTAFRSYILYAEGFIGYSAEL